MKDACPHSSIVPGAPPERLCARRHGGSGYCLRQLAMMLSGYDEDPGCAVYHYGRAEALKAKVEALVGDSRLWRQAWVLIYDALRHHIAEGPKPLTGGQVSALVLALGSLGRRNQITEGDLCSLDNRLQEAALDSIPDIPEDAAKGETDGH